MIEMQKKYAARFILSIALYAIFLIASTSMMGNRDLPFWAGILLSLLPVVPAMYGFWALFQAIRSMDEFQQRIQLEATAFSLSGTAFLTFTYGFMENAGMPPMSVIWVLPIIVMLWGVGGWIAGRRYR